MSGIESMNQGMTAYADAVHKPIRTLTEREQKLLLKATGEHLRGFRDHVLFSLALATALREHEAVALNVGDVFDERGRARQRVQLRVFKRSNKDAKTQEIVLSEGLRAKLDKLYRAKRAAGESVEPGAPIFVSQKGNRLSTRQVRTAMKVWQERAGIERKVSFHGMRHSSCTNLYRRTKDIRLVQRFARHASVTSTMRYTHPADEELIRSVQDLPC
jgi:site-specific recombinase XerD